MPRSSHTSELQYDLEMEKTARRLKKETKQWVKPSSSSLGLKLAFDLVESSIVSEEEIEVMANERTLRELATPDLNQQPLCITYPTLEIPFELKSGLIHLLPSFRGLAGEDPHKHLKEFHVVCSTMKPSHWGANKIKNLSIFFNW